MATKSGRRLCLFLLALVVVHDMKRLEAAVITTCPEYVQEFEDLTCECTADPMPAGSPYFYWPAYSDNSTLHVRRVTREMTNGYTCTMFLNGPRGDVVYTPKVARK
jgi:hypothetical protein